MMLKKAICFVISTVLLSCSAKNESAKSRSDEGHVSNMTADSLNYKPFTIERSEIHPITSSVNDKTYHLDIKLPRSYHSAEENFPIVVLTDSDYSFPLVSSISRRIELEEFILVGISYSHGDDAAVSRTRDYTPTNSPNEPRGHSEESRLASGGADNYITFIQNDVIPYLQKKFRVDMDRRIFVGQSFGGLLASYMAVTRPDVFDYYLIGSPSLWYDEGCIYRFEEEYFTNRGDSLTTNLFFAIGEKETKSNMVTEMYDFVKKLESRNYKGLSMEAITLHEEDHLTVFPNFVTKGLIWALGKN